MSNGFPDALLQFSRSVDIVSEDTTAFIKELFDNYMKLINADYYIVLIDGAQLDEGPGLGTFQSSGKYWSRDGQNRTVRLRGDNWVPDSLMAYGYDVHKPLWVLEEGGGSLTGTNGDTPVLVDSWSGCKDLPTFKDFAGGNPKTAVVLPLDHAYRVFGILNMQFAENLKPTDVAKENFKNIADSVGAIINLYQVRQAQLSDTRTARAHLARLLESGYDSPFEKPKLFLAYSDKAVPEVIDAIREVLAEFNEVVEVKDWRNNPGAGNLHDHMREALSLCRYAICYLSEPAPDGSPEPYVDNPNVLIETGVFYALSLEPTSGCRGWIPIREEDSAASPFDISPINTVKVRRLDQDSERRLNKENLTHELKDRLKDLLKDLLR